MLESREHAEHRGATVLANIAGCSSGFEPIPPGMPPQGTAICNGIEAALKEAGMQPDDIDHVNAHGLGTVEMDRTEAQAIYKTLGDLPVIAPKSYFGNLGAGSGSVEMVVSLLALNKGSAPCFVELRASGSGVSRKRGPPRDKTHGQKSRPVAQPGAGRSGGCSNYCNRLIG